MYKNQSLCNFNSAAGCNKQKLQTVICECILISMLFSRKTKSLYNTYTHVICDQECVVLNRQQFLYYG